MDPRNATRAQMTNAGIVYRRGRIVARYGTNDEGTGGQP